jgi:hypothetical protein
LEPFDKSLEVFSCYYSLEAFFEIGVCYEFSEEFTTWDKFDPVKSQHALLSHDIFIG